MTTAELLLLFDDSQVSRVEPVGADLHLVLSAAHVRSRAMGVESDGYLSPLLLLFRDARCSGELAHVLGRVSSGALQTGGQTLRALPLPFEVSGPVQCRLDLANGTVLEIAAVAMRCVPSGDETWVESYAC